MNISKLLLSQKNFFSSQKTKDITFRKLVLKKLLKEIINKESDIIRALNKDFKKPEFETVMTETSIVISELKLSISNLNSWSKPKNVKPSLLNFPSYAKIYSEPYGNTLIISPWNYPFLLALAPLIGAVSAGNTTILKPSELTPFTSKIIRNIIESVFDSKHVAVIEGGVLETQKLLLKRWDYIFFTGSVNVGKVIAKAAANFLTPITLELGGKNPCIVDQTADIKLTAKRIIWGKFINAGQTCIAPDYLIVHSSVKIKLIQFCKDELIKTYGNNPQKSNDYPRIINTKNFNRLVKMLEKQKIIIGGEIDKDDKYISPTLIDNPNFDSEIMKNEIFGPILPILTYRDEKEIKKLIQNNEKPLALYLFTNRKNFTKKIINQIQFGGGTINDTLIHFINHRLPFGGIGESGIGNYHGKLTFDVFSHKKSIVTRGTWVDIPTRYAPYNGKLKYLKFLIKWF